MKRVAPNVLKTCAFVSAALLASSGKAVVVDKPPANSPALASGNEHANGDPTTDPLEKIDFPGKDLAKDKLVALAKVYPELANAILDAFTSCTAYKDAKDYPNGFYAETFTRRDGSCLVIYFAKFFSENLAAEAQAEVSIHEALHYANRSDPKGDSEAAELFIQSTSHKIMLEKSDELGDVETNLQLAAPESNFINLPVEKIVHALQRPEALRYPKIARDNDADTLTTHVEMLRYWPPTAGLCDESLVKVAADYLDLFKLGVQNNAITLEPVDAGVHLERVAAGIDARFYDYLTEELMGVAARADIEGEFSDVFRSGHYCQNDIYVPISWHDALGVETLLLFPKHERTTPGPAGGLNKALMIRFDYSST